MGGYQTKYTEDEVEAERQKILQMSLNSRRSMYESTYTAADVIKTWPRYYEDKIPASDRDVRTGISVSDVINQKVSLFRGDITRLELDAIVNSAAKPGKGQVNVAIMNKAGDFYKEECLQKGLLGPGEALVTGGYKLPAKYVINVLAPSRTQRSILENCYRNALNAAKQNRLRTIGFPCIATRKRNRFPRSEAASTAVRTVRRWLEENHALVDRVIFCVYTADDNKAYSKAMQEYFPVDLHDVIRRDTPSPSSLDDVEIETSFGGTTDSSSGDDSIDSTMGAAAKKPATNERLDKWRARTMKTAHNQNLEINRMAKSSLFKRLFSVYTDSSVDLTCRLSIVFTDEPGVDIGALSREYFSLTLDTLSSKVHQGSPSCEGQEDHKLPTASKIHNEIGIFCALGKAIAHSVLHGGMGFVGMSPAIVYLLTHPVSRDDLDQSEVPICLDDVANYELKEILELPNTKCLLEEHKTKLRDFMDSSNVGYMKIDDSTIEYIKQELLLYEVVSRRWAQIEELRRGMDFVKAPGQADGLYTFLCKNPSEDNRQAVFPYTYELQTDPDELLAKTECKNKRSATWEYFTKFLNDVHRGHIGPFTLNDVIAFWTGHSALPREMLTVEIVTSRGLPCASSCFLTLQLPTEHRSYEQFRDAFTTALRHGAKGFGEM